MNRALLMTPTLALVFGCSSSQGLHPDSLRTLLQQESMRFSGSPANHTTASSSVKLAPGKLGLYVKPTGFLQREFEWTDQDRDVVLAWAKALRRNSEGTDASFIPQASLKGNTLKELRASAIRYGADQLLLFDGAATVDRYNNYKAPLWYWTIVGAYLADGTHSDALCLITATLWDVKSGTLLFQEEAEGRAQKVGPAALVDDDDAVLHARQQALTALLAKLKTRFTTH